MPDDFAGGLGSCPRCQTRLRIPRKPPQGTPGFKPGMRLIAEPAQTHRAALPAIVTPGLGPSKRYTCTQCGEQYESLQGSTCPAGQCPKCKTHNQPVVDGVSFPRPPNESASRNPSQAPSEKELAPASTDARIAPDEQAPPTATSAGEDQPAPQPPPAEPSDEEWTTEGEYLLAKPARNQTPDETVLQGMAINGEMTVDEDLDARSELLSAEPDLPEMPQAAEPVVGKGWHYLQKDQQSGPVSAGQIAHLLASEKINLSTLVWRDGMDGWVPLESVEELAPAFDTADEPAPTSPARPGPRRSARRAKRTMSAHCQVVLWMGIASACVVLMLYVLRETILLLGGRAFAIAAGGLAVVLLGGVVLSLARILARRQQFRAVSRGSRSSAWIGLGILAAALAATVMLAVVVKPPRREIPVDRYLADAQRACRVILTGQDDQMHRVIDWHHLNLNGRDLGSEYTQASSVEDKDAVVASFLQRVRPVLRAVSGPADTQPDQPGRLQWRMVNHSLQVTTVMLRNTQTGQEVRFQVQAGMLVGVTLPQPTSKPVAPAGE